MAQGEGAILNLSQGEKKHNWKMAQLCHLSFETLCAIYSLPPITTCQTKRALKNQPCEAAPRGGQRLNLEKDIGNFNVPWPHARWWGKLRSNNFSHKLINHGFLWWYLCICVHKLFVSIKYQSSGLLYCFFTLTRIVCTSHWSWVVWIFVS